MKFYDGYHFSDEDMTHIYNPFSLIKALASGRIQNFWASSGATSLLSKFVDDMELRLKDFESCPIMCLTLETSGVTGGGPELFLYQSGCPYRQLGLCQLSDAMKSLKVLIADVPYSNKKLASMDMEERYRLIISSILNAIGFRTEVEHMLSTGRIDILCTTPRYTYVIELKLSKNGGLLAAEKQIKSNLYLEPFEADKKREVVGLAIELEDMGKGMLGWKRISNII